MIEEKHIYKLSSDIEFSKFNENEYLLPLLSDKSTKKRSQMNGF